MVRRSKASTSESHRMPTSQNNGDDAGLSQILTVLDSIKHSDVEPRVRVIETELDRMDKNTRELTSIIREQARATDDTFRRLTEAHQVSERMLIQKIDTLGTTLANSIAEISNKMVLSVTDLSKRMSVMNKADWSTLLGYAVSAAVLIGMFWGLAVAPLNMRQDVQTKDVEQLNIELRELRTAFTDHAKSPVHSLLTERVDRIIKDVEAVEARLRVIEKPVVP